MSVIRKLAGHTAIYGISSIAARMLYFFLTPLYTDTDLISQADYGIVTDVFAYIAILMVLFTYRMEMAYFRYGAEQGQAQRSFRTAMSSHIISTLGLGLLLLPLAPVLAGLAQYAQRSELIVLALLILSLDTLSEVPMARLRLEGRPLRFAAVQGGSIVLNLALNLFFILFCPLVLQWEGWEAWHPFIKSIYDPTIGIGYIFIANVAASAFKFLLLWPAWRDFRLQIDWEHWKKMMRYSLPLILVGFSFVINETLDRKLLPILGKGSDEEKLAQLGIYGANYKLAMIISLFTQAFRYGAEPFFFQQKNRLDARELYARIARYFFLAGTLGFLGIVCYLRVIRYFIGEAYWVGLHVVPILLLANLMLGLYYNFTVWYKLTEQTRWGAIISGGGALVTIILNIWWIPIYGYTGCAVATLICYTGITIACYLVGRRYYPIPYPIGRMARYLALALSLAGLSALFYGMPLLPNLLLNTGLLAIWGVAIWRWEGPALRAFFRKG